MAFDETAIVTWANMVTVGRVLASPFLFMLIPDDGRGSYVALIVWIVLCSSDGFDGYLARKHGITRSGAFLDPLADGFFGQVHVTGKPLNCHLCVFFL